MTSKVHPLQDLIDLHHELHPQPAALRITRMTERMPITLQQFQYRKRRAIAKGYQAVSAGKTERPCPTCGSVERDVIVLRLEGRDRVSYDVCDKCWWAVETIIIYEEN